MSSEESPVERLAHEFALHLAGYLEHAREIREFDELGLIASPWMLGHLRAALTKPTQALVYGELAKDLDQPEPSDLIPYLEQLAHR
jgi:protein required for attachment to host cells